jgi:hypothetical protein
LSRRRHRSLPVGILASVLVVAAAVPATAGVPVRLTVTRWVDDDGSAGPGACAGRGEAFTTIQAAVDGSDTNDRVVVCPGRYDGRVLIVEIEGLSVVGSPDFTSIVGAPVSSQSKPTISVLNAPRTRLAFLTVAYRAGAACDGASSRRPADAAILVEESDATTIRGNVIKPLGDDTINDECGFETGIHIKDSRDVRVVTNLIRDFQRDGIRLDGATGRVEDNSVRYFHRREDPGVDKGVTGISLVGVPPDPDATLQVIDNVIRSLPTAPEDTPALGRGVEASFLHVPLDLHDNTLRDLASGIILDDVVDSEILENVIAGTRPDDPSSPGVGVGIDVRRASRTVVASNTISSIRTGIRTDASDDGRYLTNVMTDDVSEPCDERAYLGENVWHGNRPNASCRDRDR